MKFMLPLGREPFNGWSHLIAAVAAMIGSVPLIHNALHQGAMLPAKCLYAGTLVLAFGASALFHLAVVTPKKLRTLRNIDHIGISSLMIGTYAPIAVAMLPPKWNVFCFGAFVFFVCAGLLVANAFSRRVLSISYIIIACLPLIPVPFIWSQHWQNILWFASGSLIYSIGAFCYLTKFPNKGKFLQFHGVWHVCAIMGAIVHYLVIYHL